MHDDGDGCDKVECNNKLLGECNDIGEHCDHKKWLCIYCKLGYDPLLRVRIIKIGKNDDEHPEDDKNLRALGCDGRFYGDNNKVLGTSKGDHHDGLVSS